VAAFARARRHCLRGFGEGWLSGRHFVHDRESEDGINLHLKKSLSAIEVAGATRIDAVDESRAGPPL
jgi:hypothetical protein